MSTEVAHITSRQLRLDARQGGLIVKDWKITSDYDPSSDFVLHTGDSLAFLRTLPPDTAALIISSPPYNLGKEYEVPQRLHAYLDSQKPVLKELVRVLTPTGSLCWQVGNFVESSEVFPLDIYYYPIFKELGLRLRNRIVWHFGHGLHASRRFSGRYETILWFTKGDDYKFNLDSVRVPAKYPGKRSYKGPNKGELSGNPLGANPTDFWKFLSEEWGGSVWDIPNVKANHPEKTSHPCQFPVELVERCVLAFTSEREVVLDPYSGVGTAAIAALKNGRRSICVDREAKYNRIAKDRVRDLQAGKLPVRKLGTPVYQPTGREKIAKTPEEWLQRAD